MLEAGGCEQKGQSILVWPVSASSHTLLQKHVPEHEAQMPFSCVEHLWRGRAMDVYILAREAWAVQCLQTDSANARCYPRPEGWLRARYLKLQ